MYDLRVAANWSAQIEGIRNNVTEPTRIRRLGSNGFYRMCSDTEDIFTVMLRSSDGGQSLRLQLYGRNLYIHQIGQRAFERYPSNLDTKVLHRAVLDQAIGAVSKGVGGGDTWFHQQAMIVFCVAESLRFDHVAKQVETMIATYGNLRLAGLLPIAKQWANTSDAIFSALPSDNQEKLMNKKPFDPCMADAHSISGEFRTIAEHVSALCRPTNSRNKSTKRR